MDNCHHQQDKNCVMSIECENPRCSHVKNISCSCPKEEKLPKVDLSFVRAQRMKVGDKCVFQMSSEDKTETEKQLKTLKRKEKDELIDFNRNKKIKSI